ncbi:hypothetical protein C2845_PM03G10580 [Panicum miliaceum]|uniref:Uncharacterized protein n=1 Tax=Panicum miliaceum TaxID=4540 RepID=A0A3L6TCU9_PANMI|nr:hypothetical protein C2845_PM03G10580 [Panicum miliaceum]
MAAARSSSGSRHGSPLAGERRPHPPTACAPPAAPPPGAAYHSRFPRLLWRPARLTLTAEERRPGESVKGRCGRGCSVVARPRRLTSAFSPAWTDAWMAEQKSRKYDGERGACKQLAVEGAGVWIRFEMTATGWNGG